MNDHELILRVLEEAAKKGYFLYGNAMEKGVKGLPFPTAITARCDKALMSPPLRQKKLYLQRP